MRVSALLLLVLSLAVGCESTPQPVPPLAPAKRDGGVPVFDLSAKELAAAASERVDEAIPWGDTVVLHGPDTYVEIDPVTARSRPIKVEGITEVLDLAESGGKRYVLGRTGKGLALRVQARNQAWADFGLPQEVLEMAAPFAAQLWLAGGPGEPIIAGPFAAYVHKDGRWLEYRYQRAYIRYRKGPKFYAGDRIYSSTRLGILGGEVKFVDLKQMPREWKKIESGGGFELSAVAPGTGPDTEAWLGGNHRTEDGTNRSALFRCGAHGLDKPIALQGDRALLAIVEAKSPGDAVWVLTSGGVTKVSREGANAGAVIRFTMPVDSLSGLLRDSADNLYLVSEYQGVYQLRVPPSGEAELRRIDLTPPR